MSDGRGGFDIGTVMLTVVGADDAAVIGDPTDADVNENENVTTVSGPEGNLGSLVLEVDGGMSRFLLNIAKRSLPRLTLRGAGLVSKDAVC